jgi:hypothetical protein
LAASLPLATSNGIYTLGDSRNVWRGLAALSMDHMLHCALSTALGTSYQAPNSAVLRLPRSEFITRLAYYSQESEDLVSLVAGDLILAETGKRDLRATPLIASEGYVLVIPHLITALLWEASTQLLWARKYSGAYGTHITRHKTGLAQEFADAFDHRRFLVSAMRKIRDATGNVIGDAVWPYMTW